MKEISSTNVKIICTDEQEISASLFQPHNAMKGAVLIAPATGIKRQFYISFANFLAEHGYAVLTFDNRGIGESLTGSIKHSEASIQCWGEKDMPAALNYLKASFPATKYHLIGHSAGGQLIGLMSNVKEISSVFNVACSSGQLQNMRFSHRMKAHFFMNLFIPFSNLIFGYTKSQWFGMGEPLPKNVAKQWRAWCNAEGYVKEAFGKTVFEHLYDELTTPSLWVNATDDDIANDANVADMLTVFPKLNAQTLTLAPENYGLAEIGHMKFFSKKSNVLWKYALDWLAMHK